MNKVEKRIGIINASFFRGEITEIVTISLTTDGGFNLISTDKKKFTQAIAFVDYIAEIHRVDAYSAFVMGSYGINETIIRQMRDRGLRVISMQDALLAIDAKISGDIIDATPNIYTPKPKDNPEGIVAMDGNTYRAIDKMEQRRPRMSVSMSLKGENVNVEVL